MSDHCVLALSPSRVTLYRWTHRQLVSAFVFSNDEPGRNALERRLRAERPAPAVVLADLPDEEFRLERLPHVVRYRRQFLARTAQRIFGGAPFCHHSLQGREQSARRDDIVLFSSLARADALEPWMAVLTRAGTPPRAVFSVPLLVSRFVRNACKQIPHSLMIVFFTPGGLRLIHLRAGKLSFSRLVPASDPIEMKSHVASTLQFLQRHSQVDLSPPELLLVGRAADAPLLMSEPMRIHRLPEEVLSSTLPQSNGDPVELTLSRHAAFHPGIGYARPGDRANFLAHRRRKILRAASTVAGAVAGILALHFAVTARVDALAIRHLRDQVALLERSAGNLQTLERIARMRNVIATAEWLRRNAPDASTFPQEIRDTVARFPEFRVDEIGWWSSSQPEWPATESADPVAEGESFPIGPLVYEGVRLRGEVISGGDQREVLDRLSSLERALRKLPGVVRVEITEFPWDLDPAHSLAGGLEPGGLAPPRFSLRLLRGNHAHVKG